MSESQIRKGDHVQFQYGTRSVQGEVKEDRGPIGVKGRHLYLVEFQFGDQSASQIELPAADLQPATGGVTRR